MEVVPQYSHLEVNPESLPEVVPHADYDTKHVSTSTETSGAALRWPVRKVSWLWVVLAVAIVAALVGGLVGGLHKHHHPPPTG